MWGAGAIIEMAAVTISGKSNVVALVIKELITAAEHYL
jgi:hypothetical protein